MEGETANSQIDNAAILYVQQILDHVIIKKKPRGTKPNVYAKVVRKYLMFFNELQEQILTKNKMHQGFKIGPTFLKELEWVFPDDTAHIIFDALFGTDDAFKVDLRSKKRTGKVVQNTYKQSTNENPSENNTAFDVSETQFDTISVLEETLKYPENQKKITTTTAPIKEILEPSREDTCKQLMKEKTSKYINCELQRGKELFINALFDSHGTQSDMINAPYDSTETQFDTNDTLQGIFRQQKNNATTTNLNENIQETSRKINTIAPLPLAQENLSSHYFLDQAIQSHIQCFNTSQQQEKDESIEQFGMGPPAFERIMRVQYQNWQEIVKEKTQFFSHAEKHGEKPKRNEVQQVKLNNELENTGEIDSKNRVSIFYPPDSSELQDSQLGAMMQEQADPNFLNSLKWDSIQKITESTSNEQILFFEKFYRVLNQFSSAMNSKISEKYSDSFDKFTTRMSCLRIKNESQTSSCFESPNDSSNIEGLKLDLKRNYQNEHREDREVMLTKLLRSIFGYLNDILNDFAKLHNTICDWPDILVKQVFTDIKSYFDERFIIMLTESNAKTSFNICCNFIRATIDNILTSYDLCQFLKWEEQCFLLEELSSNKAVCQNILEFLLEKVLNLLKGSEGHDIKQKKIDYNNSGILEKLQMIFSMMQNLVEKYVDSASSEVWKKENEDYDEDEISQLWWSNTVFDGRKCGVNISQDFEDDELFQKTEEKLIIQIKELIDLTGDSICFLSSSARVILKILKKADGEDKIKYSFTESENSTPVKKKPTLNKRES